MVKAYESGLPMVYKVTPKELQGRKDEFVIVDVREADELFTAVH